MPQAILPIFSAELTCINERIAFQKKDGQVFYFQGMLPFFCHDEQDTASFRYITAQMAVLGTATQADIARAFGISAISLKRYTKQLRKQGSASFFQLKRTRGAAVLTKEVLQDVQEDLNAGKKLAEIAKEKGFKLNTLQKALRAGRLHQPEKKTL